MKKATAGLIAASLVILFFSNAWAQPSFRVDLGGNGLGFSIYSQPYGTSQFWYNPYQPYYNYYARPYPARPYKGWSGHRGPHHHRHWQHHRHSHHYKGRHHHKRHGHKHPNYKNRGHQRHYRR